ncbi:MAG: hypothetical protein AAF581_02385 [Planctomycetota bacterium]
MTTTNTTPQVRQRSRRHSGWIAALCIAALIYCTPATAQFSDCNANGMDDTIDLAIGNSVDGDNNGIPDECQGYIEQLDYVDGNGLPLPGGQNSRHGRATLEYMVAPDVQWGHLVVNGQWIVRNLPLLPLAPVGTMHEASVLFDLGVPPGLDVPFASTYMEITPLQLDPLGPMPLGPPLQQPVPDVSISQSGSKKNPSSNPYPDLNASPGNFMLQATFLFWELNLRPGMPNMNVKWNHCTPGAAANSFECLKQRFCLPVGQTTDEMYDKLRSPGYMNTTKADGTAIAWFDIFGDFIPGSNDALAGIQAFVNEKGLADKVTVLSNGLYYDGNAFDPNKVHMWLQAGYDVTLDYGYTGAGGGGHSVVVAGSIKCGNQICIVVRSDHEQDFNTYQAPGDPGQRLGGVDKWDVHCFQQLAGGDWQLTNEAPNIVDGAIALCPVPPSADDCVSSNTPVDWSPCQWTKDGVPIGSSFANGVVTGVPGGPMEAYDSVPLPMWPNDWHWDAIYEFNGQPMQMFVDMVNFGNEDLFVQLIGSNQFPMIGLFVDVGADSYLIETPIGPVHGGQWSLYPSDIPPSLGFAPVGASRARAAAPISLDPQFQRGDCNSDAAFNVGDPVRLLNYLFTVASDFPQCFDSCDANDDGALNIADSVAMLTFLFPSSQTTNAIPAPFGACGQDPTEDQLPCDLFGPCP